MAHGYQIGDQAGLYFMTFQVVDWIDIFTRMEYKEILAESFEYCIFNKGLELFAYVIMTNHIHLIARADKGFELSSIVRDYKKYTANQILIKLQESGESRKDWMLNLLEFSAKKHKRNSHFQLWTHENHPVELLNHQNIDKILNYIHQNPVRAGIVSEPEHYVYSSASNYAGMASRLKIKLL